MGDPDPLGALEVRARNYCDGDTDLTWTRLTRWRGLLAAALDAYPMDVTRASVSAAPDNAAGTLLAAWLSDRLDVPVTRTASSPGSGITEVSLGSGTDEIRLSRTDGNLAMFSARRAAGAPGGTPPARPEHPAHRGAAANGRRSHLR